VTTPCIATTPQVTLQFFEDDYREPQHREGLLPKVTGVSAKVAMSGRRQLAPYLLTGHAMYDEADPITKALLQVHRSHQNGYLCPCGKECNKVADLLRHYFSCERVPILTSGGVALRLAICHGQQTHGRRLAEDYRRLAALTATGEQVIGVAAAIERAVGKMERLVKDEASRSRHQMTEDHRDTIRRMEEQHVVLQRSNTTLLMQIKGMETTMARNQQQLISTVQSTGRVTTAAVNMSSDITMRIGKEVLDQATRNELKRKNRDDSISAQLEELMALKQKSREVIPSKEPVICASCTFEPGPGEITWSDEYAWQCPVCSNLTEYACVTPEALLPSLVACGLPHWRVGGVIVSKECCICMTPMDMEQRSPIPGCSASFSHMICAMCSARLGPGSCPQCRGPWDPIRSPRSSVAWALLLEDGSSQEGATGEAP
jgi:hypothetical protein